ncbi:murein hydrolase activator EnvC family protein [Aquisalibacillus elongatus]|uniref:Murein DD-endopeptidase MepM/ murein hydrolase activator NlpD n=1 Tax=Aquisalibacillus elongatus TaxID=485577 RepID=A0A3N5BA60_9BACI|nr:peptidoglycan DD-metalloendopeptidase family protein [Aquisalibacillus elongatus]RPF54374.1 murein DD-endopeptidase MepM/ murein hydrolase activator NlpD [Aquisalibacillus elongatus]
MVKKTLGILSVSAVAIALVFMFNQDEAVEAQSVEEIEKELEKIQEEKNSVNNDLNSIEQDLNEAQSKKSSAEADLQSIKNEISQTESEIRLKELEIKETETKINRLEAQIEELEGEIEDLENQITELEEEIEGAEQRIADREDLLKDRIRSLQRSGGSVKYLEVIMGAEDFGDLVNRTKAVNKIMSQDQKILENHLADKMQLDEDREALEDSKKAVVSKKENVESNKSSVEDKRDQLVAQKQDLDSLVANLDQQREEQRAVLVSLEEQVHELEKLELSAEQEQRQLQKREQSLEQAKQVASGDGFVVPAKGTYGYDGSHFGQRWHPIHQEYRSHNGIDIASARGTPIYAAATGVVYTTHTGCARYSNNCSGGGFGNSIFITHNVDGQEIDTVYAHLSEVYVNEQQVVQAGEMIGRMGSTGDSTGDHLHFEVHPGGREWGNLRPANPLNYIPTP